jgi:pilus assembly protein CpaF
MSAAVWSFVRGLLEPIAPLLDDPSVSEVLVNGPEEIHVERAGRLERTERRFADVEALRAALRAVAQSLGRPLSDEQPVLEGRLPDGSRIEAILPPLVAVGPCVAIRRHHKSHLTLARLIELGSITAAEVESLGRALGARKNVLVSGGTGSGKTSLLNCLASLIDPLERIVSIEDARELALHQPHVVSLEARTGSDRGLSPVSIADLFRATLRLRPDRIVIGELRGREAFELIQAMTSGHGGCMSTLHASSPLDALCRLEAMALERDVPLPLEALRRQIASAVDVIVQVERCRDGRRRVVELAEVVGLDAEGHYALEPLVDTEEPRHGH